MMLLNVMLTALMFCCLMFAFTDFKQWRCKWYSYTAATLLYLWIVKIIWLG